MSDLDLKELRAQLENAMRDPWSGGDEARWAVEHGPALLDEVERLRAELQAISNIRDACRRNHSAVAALSRWAKVKGHV